jgi:LPXTG-motif cell wall-anchored protein
MTFAYPSLFSVDLDGAETESPTAQPVAPPKNPGSLADTGFDSALLMLLAMVLAGSGAMFLVAARRRD